MIKDKSKMIAARLEEVIKKSGLSYVELEKKTGISKSSLQRYVTRETKKITIDIIEAIAKATDADPRYLLGWDDNTDLLSEALEPPEQTARRVREMMAQEEKSPHRAPTYEDDLTDDEKKELELFAEFLRYRRGRQP